jgi:hypothetical protein
MNSLSGTTASPRQDHVTMAAEPPQSPVTEPVRRLEVRWIFPGQLKAQVARWFARFPARMESREDIYLLEPQLARLSVKVRGFGALEIKAYRDSPGMLEVAGRARGRLEFWQKWSFPFSQASAHPCGGRPPLHLSSTAEAQRHQPHRWPGFSACQPATVLSGTAAGQDLPVRAECHLPRGVAGPVADEGGGRGQMHRVGDIPQLQRTLVAGGEQPPVRG